MAHIGEKHERSPKIQWNRQVRDAHYQRRLDKMASIMSQENKKGKAIEGQGGGVPPGQHRGLEDGSLYLRT